jgi:hypothetical protein
MKRAKRDLSRSGWGTRRATSHLLYKGTLSRAWDHFPDALLTYHSHTPFMDAGDPMPDRVLVDAARNWLTMDGLWFLSVERAFGLEHAMELDKQVWREFSRIEAERIKRHLALPEGGGLDALEQALPARLISLVNEFVIRRPDAGTLEYFLPRCRTQDARERKGFPLFPCREIGMVEYSVFAATIDPRIRTTCIACPPDPEPRNFRCGWRFTLRNLKEVTTHPAESGGTRSPQSPG